MNVVLTDNLMIPHPPYPWRRGAVSIVLSFLIVLIIALPIAWAESPRAAGEPVQRVAVGPGAVESSIRQIVRTVNGRVYIAAVDDQGGPADGFQKSTFLRMYKSTTAGIPVAFKEIDRAHHPRTSGKQTLSGGDMRLDRRGLIHLVYYRTLDGATIHRIFDTNTDTWEKAATVVTTFSGHPGNAYYGSRGRVINSIALDRDGTPYLTVAGTEGVKIFRELKGEWIEDITLSTLPSLHPAMTFDRLNRLHVVWIENPNENSSIHYAMRDGAGVWGSEEIVFPGDANVLANVNLDQSPSLAVDSQNQPVVLYLSGEPGMADNFVRTRSLTAGLWIADDPPDLFSHSPGLYMRGDIKFALLGHDTALHPGYLTHRPSDPEWSAIIPFQSEEPSYWYNGSASARYDPHYEVDCTVIDVVYSDASSDLRGDFNPDIYYTAIQLNGATSGNGSCREVTQ